jgi:hypothetical protein
MKAACSLLLVAAALGATACGDDRPPRPTPEMMAYYYSQRYSATATSYSTVVQVSTVTLNSTATVTSTSR